jgi:hydroxymethylglutaryl-CoA synthase
MFEDDFFLNVGIDSAAFYTSKYYVDLKDLANVRGIDPNKYLKGLLTHEMRIPAEGEDIITMAVKAAQHAMIKGKIDPKTIDAVFVGTETMTYAVKSVSNILSEILGVSVNAITQDTYNACASATLSVLNAIGLINNDIVNKALVIGADISSYALQSPGEPTQGLAAAALIISKNPRVASFSKRFGKYSANVDDFVRLPYEKYPVVMGHYSIDSYIQFQQGALDDFLQGRNSLSPNFFIFHSPFAKLPLKNIQNLLKTRWNVLSQAFLENSFDEKIVCDFEDEYIENIVAPVVAELEKKGEINNIDYTKELIIGNLKRKLLPILKVPMNIGNMYSASVWSQIIYYLEKYAEPDQQVYFGSYGSGATCLTGVLKVLTGFDYIVKKTPLVTDFMEEKERKTISEYEKLRENINANNYFYAEIEPHEHNNGFFIELNVCENACMISKLTGLDYCPDGRHNPQKLKNPLYGIVKTEPVKSADMADILSNKIFRVSPETKKGQIVECNMLRAMGEKEISNCARKGFLNWFPTYKPIPHPLE